MERKTCPTCGHDLAAGAACQQCAEERTVVLTDEQRTMLLTDRKPTPGREPNDQKTDLDDEKTVVANLNLDDEKTVIADIEHDDQKTMVAKIELDDEKTVIANIELDDEKTVIATLDDDQRTMVVTPDMLRRPATPPAPPAQAAPAPARPAPAPPAAARTALPAPTAAPTPPPPATPPAPPVKPAPAQRPAPGMGAPSPSPQHWGVPPHQQQPAYAGFQEEPTTTLTGALLGARALPPRDVPKTSYRKVIPALILALVVAIGVGAFMTIVASGAIKDFFDQMISAG